MFDFWAKYRAKPVREPSPLDTRNFAVIYLKFKQRGQTLMVFCQKDANGQANCEDPDQTAPLGAV